MNSRSVSQIVESGLIAGAVFPMDASKCAEALKITFHQTATQPGAQCSGKEGCVAVQRAAAGPLSPSCILCHHGVQLFSQRNHTSLVEFCVTDDDHRLL